LSLLLHNRLLLSEVKKITSDDGCCRGGGVGGVVEVDGLARVEGILQRDGVAGLEGGVEDGTHRGQVTSKRLPWRSHDRDGHGQGRSSNSKAHYDVCISGGRERWVCDRNGRSEGAGSGWASEQRSKSKKKRKEAK